MTEIFNINHCDKRCWECVDDCPMKRMFLMPEQEFNNQIIASLKASAGMYISSGGNPEFAKKSVMENAVALSISRKEYLKIYGA